MRIYFFLIFFVMPFVSLSQDFDSISIDSSYRLVYFKNSKKLIDRNVRRTFTESKPPSLIRHAPFGDHHGIGSNYGSTQNINPKVAAIISVVFLLFILYFIYRVRRSLKKDER